MVDFNRWIVEVLADTRSEGIQWEPSYGENPWLALEEQPQDPPLEEDIAVDAAQTNELLKSMAEFYMVRCEGLLDANASLATHVNELKILLSDALTRVFESKQHMEHQQELMELQQGCLVTRVQFGDFLSRYLSYGEDSTDVAQGQISRAFEALSMIERGSPAYQEGFTSIESERIPREEIAGNLPRDEPATRDKDADIELEITTVNQEEIVHTTPDNKFQSEEGVLASMPTTPSTAASVSIPESGGMSYQQLAKMRTSEDDDGSWIRHALRVLQEERKRRRFSRTFSGNTDLPEVSATTSKINTTTPARSIRPDPLEFEQLIAIQDPAGSDENLEWYRSALRYLKQERQRRASRRDRAESFSSTITIFD